MIAGHVIDGGFTRDYIQSLGFNVGTRVKVKTKIDKTVFSFVGTVVGNYDDFFNVEVQTEQYSSYIVSINKADLVIETGNTRVRRIA